MKIVIPLQILLVSVLVLGISVFLMFFLKTKETYVDITPQTNLDIQLQACPSGTTPFDSKGDILCCRGDIVDGVCNGNTVCSVSSDTNSMRSCLQLLRKSLTQKAVKSCPPSMRNYFEDEAKKSKGCCSASRTPDGKKPRADVPGQRVCIIYDTEIKNLHNRDSCYNIKRVETSMCPQGGRPSLIVPQNEKHPAYLSCTLTSPSMPVPKICYEDKSFKEYLNSSFPSWKSDISENDILSFCSVAHSYYIKKSLPIQEIRKKKASLVQ